MSQFFISCKESKIENNRSFYGCFNIGPFEPSQSITIANALRRTLLSELYGLSIISVEMEGVTHEYSNLNGVKDSILDILLNLKDIVLKKTINTVNIKPQIGYLKIRGPGVIRAAHLKLPPFIQSVDPDQYIATLTHDGFLNMKFIIQYSNKWLSNQNFQSNNQISTPTPFPLGHRNELGKTKDFFNKDELKKKENLSDCTSEFYLHLKKRRLILKKLKQIGLRNSNLYINIFSKFIYKQSKKITIDFLYHKSYDLNKKKNHAINKISTNLVSQNLKKSTLNSPWTSYLQVPALRLLKIKSLYGALPPCPSRSLTPPWGGVPPKGSGDAHTESYLEKVEFPEIQKKRKILQAINSLVKKHSNRYLALNLRNNRILNNPNKIILKEYSTLFSKSLPSLAMRGAGDGGASIDIGNNRKKKNFQENNTFISKKKKQFGSINKLPNFFNSSPLTIDSIFNPVTKVNYIIEVNDFKISQDQFSKSNETSELLELLNVSKIETKLVDFTNNFFDASTDHVGSDPAGNEKIPPIDPSQKRRDGRERGGYPFPLGSKGGQMQNYSNNVSNTTTIPVLQNSNFVENILEIKHEINFIKKDIPKHNIIFEIWTNGSIHPRDAIYQGFKNLVRIFSKLNKINAFMINSLTLNSLENNTLNNKEIKKKFFLKKIKQNEIASTISNPLMLSTEMSSFSTLNDVSYLSTYMTPKLKNFYFNKNKWALQLEGSGLQAVPSNPLPFRGDPPPTPPFGKGDKWEAPISQSSGSESDQTIINSELKDNQETNFMSNNKDPISSNISMLYKQKSESIDYSFRETTGDGGELEVAKLSQFNMKQDIGILNLSLRSFSILKRLNINTIKELKLLFSNNNSLNFQKLGKICLEEIEQSLRKLE